VKNLMSSSKKPFSVHYGSPWGIFLFLLPGVGIYTLFMLYPSILSLYYSVLEWQGGPILKAPFVGLHNFAQMFKDRYILIALGNNLRMLTLNWAFQLPIALMLAYVLSRLRRGITFYRFIFYIPVILPAATMGLLWRFIFSGNKYGLLNNVLKQLNLEELIRPWLSGNGIVQWTTSFPGAYDSIGFFIIIFLAGLVGISEELYEASAIDGANSWQQFLFITIPSMRGVYVYSMILALQAALGGFIFPLLMTKGGPVHLSETLISYSLYLLWEKKTWGYGSAVATLSFLLGIIATMLVWKFGRRGQDNVN
jgi:raffinose/stachyose/melibiose transport system permease protein